MQEYLKQQIKDKSFEEVIQKLKNIQIQIQLKQQLQLAIFTSSQEELQKCMQISCLLLNKNKNNQQTIKHILERIINTTSCKYAFVLYRSFLPSINLQVRIKYFMALTFFTNLLNSPIIQDIYELFKDLQSLEEQLKQVSIQQSQDIIHVQNYSLKNIINTIRGSFLYEIVQLSFTKKHLYKTQIFLSLSSHLINYMKNINQVVFENEQKNKIYQLDKGNFIMLFQQNNFIQKKQIIEQILTITPINKKLLIPLSFIHFILRENFFSKQFRLIIIINNIAKNQQFSQEIIKYFLQMLKQNLCQFLANNMQNFAVSFCLLISYMHNCSVKLRQQMLCVMTRIDWGHPMQLQYIYQQGMTGEIFLRIFYISQYRKLILKFSDVWKQIPILSFLKQLNANSNINYVEYIRSLTYLWIISAKKQKLFNQINECIEYLTNLAKLFQKNIQLKKDQEKKQIEIFVYNIQQLKQLIKIDK